MIFILFVIRSVVMQNVSESSFRERLKRQNPVCGVPSQLSQGLIYNGESFQRGSWPWMVALMYKMRAKPLKFFCGGTLVSDKKVVTGKNFCIEELS